VRKFPDTLSPCWARLYKAAYAVVEHDPQWIESATTPENCKVPPKSIDRGVDEDDTLKERTPTPTMPKQLPLPLTFAESQQRFRSTYPRHGGKE